MCSDIESKRNVKGCLLDEVMMRESLAPTAFGNNVAMSTYGFVYVDRFNDGHGSLERAKKKSFYRYKEIIESNGEKL